MKKRTGLVVVVVVILAAVWWWRRGADQAPDQAALDRGEDPTLLLDRIWIDSKPEKYTDYTHVMLTLSGAPIGIFQKSSAYQVTAEFYEYRRRQNRLMVNFPQTGTRREVSYRVHRCDELSPFDLCLDLSENPWGGPLRYYGLTDPGQEAALLGETRHNLEHHLATAPRPTK
jgi:hypothetical protein